MIMTGPALIMPCAGPALIMATGPPVVNFMPFNAAGMFNLPPTGDARIVEIHPFRAHLMVGQEGDAVMADPVKHKPAANKPVMIRHEAAPEQERHPPERRPEHQVIMRPKMVEWDKDIGVGAETEVRIHSQPAIPHQTNSGNESGAGRCGAQPQ